MKVLFISNDPLIFDDHSAVRARLRAYAGHFGELHVLSTAAKHAEPVDEGNLILHPVRVSKLLRVPVMVYDARAIIRARGVEVVSGQDPFEYGLVARLARIGTRARLHIQIHTDFLSPYFARESLLNRVRVLIAGSVLHAARGIRVVSVRIQHSLLVRYGRRIVFPVVIPVALPIDIPEPVPLPANSFMFSLMTASRLESEKHIEDILAALVLVRRTYPNVGLFIAGDGSLRGKLERKVAALELSGNVVFLGMRSDVRGLMSSAQAFIQASAYEGYGLSLIEAALAKVAIVTTDVGIVGEVLQPEADVLVFPVGAPEAIAACVMSLIDNNGLRTALSARAYVAAANHLASFVDQPALVATDIAALTRTATMRI